MSVRAVVAAFLVLGVVVLVGCGREDETEDDDTSVSDDDLQDDDSAGDDDLDDDSADDDDDDSAREPPAGDWPTELPPCDAYQEPSSWFEVSSLSDLADSFFFGPNSDPIPGTVAVNGDLLNLTGDDWSVDLTWISSEILPPLSDGDGVQVFCTWLDFDYGSTILSVLDLQGDLLLLHADQAPDLPWPGVESPMYADYACEYQDLEAIPLHPDLDWYRVYGRSVEGEIAGRPFEVPHPGISVTTNDGQYSILVVRNYYAVPWTTSDCCHYKFLMEVVRVE